MYIRTNRAALSDRYLAFDTVARRNMSVGIVKSMKSRRGVVWLGWRAAAGRYGRAAKSLPYEFGDSQGWSGKSLRDIVRLLEQKHGSQGLWTAYEFFHGLGSVVAHSSAQSMQEYMRRPHRTSYHQNGQRRAYLRDLPMLLCRWCLITGYLSAQEHFRLGEDFLPSDAIVDAFHLFRSLIVVLGEDLKGFDSKFFPSNPQPPLC